MKYITALILTGYVFAIYPTVIVEWYPGQLGNHFFSMAAAISLAYDNQCDIALPSLDVLNISACRNENRSATNYFGEVYRRISEIIPIHHSYSPEHEYRYNGPVYSPIPYAPNIIIEGYFQCEKYFRDNRGLICELFAITTPIETYLSQRYPEILAHPKTVGIHVRTAYYDWLRHGFSPTFFNSWVPPDLEFYKRAIEFFDEDSLFVVCSDHPVWCRNNFAGIHRNFVFIENQEYIYDFFLLTKCKDVIISASTFGWWAAYLNPNPNKRVLYRNPFFSIEMNHPMSVHFKVPEWIPVDMPLVQPPNPVFD